MYIQYYTYYLSKMNTAEYVMEHENDANSGAFSGLVPSTIQMEDYISKDDNLLTEDNTLHCLYPIWSIVMKTISTNMKTNMSRCTIQCIKNFGKQ